MRPESRPSPGRVRSRRWRAPCPPRVRAMFVVVLLELGELTLEISCGPEQHAIQTFAPRTDSATTERAPPGTASRATIAARFQ